MEKTTFVACDISDIVKKGYIDIIEKYIEDFDFALSILKKIYKKDAKYYNYSELLPKLDKLARQEFNRYYGGPFYYCSINSIMESQDRRNIKPLIRYRSFFKREYKRILRDKNYSNDKVCDLLSQLLNHIYEAIDDVRIFGLVYSKKNHIKGLSEYLIPKEEESFRRNSDRSKLLITSWTQ